MSTDPDSGWKDVTARKLISCEALIELLDKLQPIEDIGEISSTVAREWKYIARVAAWRLTLAEEDGIKIVDGYRGEAHIAEQPVPSPWDDFHFRSQLPIRIKTEELDGDPPPPDHLMTKALAEIIVMPIIREGLCIGVLSVAANHEPFGEIETRYVRILGNHFADKVFGIVRRQRHLDELRSKATRDALTGIFNRSAALDRLDILRRLSRRTAEPISVLLLDVDHFRDINARFGHLTGDRILYEIASRLESVTRDSDIIGRYGGEKFISVLYPCGTEEARKSAERLRERIADEPFRIDGIPDLYVTVSIGASTIDEDDDGMESLLKRADGALYRSKDDGRNRVSVG